MEIDSDFSTECHALWARRDAPSTPLERQLDEMLNDYLFYPEFEWPIYNVRPPDTHPLVASWRASNGNGFIFLLETSESGGIDNPNYLVIIVGKADEIRKINSLVGIKKLSLLKTEKRELAKESASKNLNEESENKSIEQFAKVIGIFAVIVNAFSFYLRNLPPPENIIEELKDAYSVLVLIVHFSALLLLLLIVLLSIAYTARYGYMMLRRMQ